MINTPEDVVFNVLKTILQGPLDETKLKKMILNFEKKVMKNQELRIKFPDDPKK